MFFVVEMSDTVRIHPWLFNVNQEDSISVELNKKLANKVVLPSTFSELDFVGLLLVSAFISEISDCSISMGKLQVVGQNLPLQA